jgi:hypothetical protein
MFNGILIIGIPLSIGKIELLQNHKLIFGQLIAIVTNITVLGSKVMFLPILIYFPTNVNKNLLYCTITTTICVSVILILTRHWLIKEVKELKVLKNTHSTSMLNS